jgi:hypothetical protein
MTILLTCDMRHGLDESAEVKVPVGGKIAPQTDGKVRARFFTVKEGNDEMPTLRVREECLHQGESGEHLL